jgi:hypothetical protein
MPLDPLPQALGWSRSASCDSKTIQIPPQVLRHLARGLVALVRILLERLEANRLQVLRQASQAGEMLEAGISNPGPTQVEHFKRSKLANSLESPIRNLRLCKVQGV